MADRRSALAALYHPGDVGALPPDGPGVTMAVRHGLAMVQVAALGDEAAVQSALGAEAPLRGAASGGATLLWIGPGRWLAVADGSADGVLAARLAEQLGEAAAVTELGHARTVLRLSGARVPDLLSKECGVDLDPQIFPPGSCAPTLLGHVGVLLHAVDDAPSFDLYLPRSYALSVWEWLLEAAAEYGLRVTEPVRGSG
jgi:sarcosine oxidase subunit gamma